MRVAAASTGFNAFADDQLLTGRPQFHGAGVPEHPPFDLAGVGRQGNAVNASNRAVGSVAQQRQQARMSCAWPEWSARMEAQYRIDIRRQPGKIDAAGLTQVARRQRAGDRLRLFP
jgi:hypothetical protein